MTTIEIVRGYITLGLIKLARWTCVYGDTYDALADAYRYEKIDGGY